MKKERPKSLWCLSVGSVQFLFWENLNVECQVCHRRVVARISCVKGGSDSGAVESVKKRSSSVVWLDILVSRDLTVTRYAERTPLETLVCYTSNYPLWCLNRSTLAYKVRTWWVELAVWIRCTCSLIAPKIQALCIDGKTIFVYFKMSTDISSGRRSFLEIQLAICRSSAGGQLCLLAFLDYGWWWAWWSIICAYLVLRGRHLVERASRPFAHQVIVAILPIRCWVINYIVAIVSDVLAIRCFVRLTVVWSTQRTVPILNAIWNCTAISSADG